MELLLNQMKNSEPPPATSTTTPPNPESDDAMSYTNSTAPRNASTSRKRKSTIPPDPSKLYKSNYKPDEDNPETNILSTPSSPAKGDNPQL